MFEWILNFKQTYINLLTGNITRALKRVMKNIFSN